MQMAPIWLLQLYCFIRNILPKLNCSSTAVRRFVLPQLSVYLWPWCRPHGTSGLWLRWMDPPNVPNPVSFTNKRIEKKKSQFDFIGAVLPHAILQYSMIPIFLYFIVTEISFVHCKSSLSTYSHIFLSRSLWSWAVIFLNLFFLLNLLNWIRVLTVESYLCCSNDCQSQMCFSLWCYIYTCIMLVGQSFFENVPCSFLKPFLAIDYLASAKESRMLIFFTAAFLTT